MEEGLYRYPKPKVCIGKAASIVDVLFIHPMAPAYKIDLQIFYPLNAIMSVLAKNLKARTAKYKGTPQKL